MDRYAWARVLVLSRASCAGANVGLADPDLSWCGKEELGFSMWSGAEVVLGLVFCLWGWD